jgi:hypothetical protein
MAKEMGFETSGLSVTFWYRGRHLGVVLRKGGHLSMLLFFSASSNFLGWAAGGGMFEECC